HEWQILEIVAPLPNWHGKWLLPLWTGGPLRSIEVWAQFAASRTCTSSNHHGHSSHYRTHCHFCLRRTNGRSANTCNSEDRGHGHARRNGRRLQGKKRIGALAAVHQGRDRNE